MVPTQSEFRESVLKTFMAENPTVDATKAAKAVDSLVQAIAKHEGTVELQTPQFDARFPNTNQTKNCWQNYVDFHKCVKAKGTDYPLCDFFKKNYVSLCPVAAAAEQSPAGGSPTPASPAGRGGGLGLPLAIRHPAEDPVSLCLPLPPVFPLLLRLPPWY